MVVNNKNKIRVSSYLIPIKVDDSSFMLLHGYSGAMDIVDKSIADALCCHASFKVSELDTDTVEYLLKRGYLTQKTKNEEQDYVRRMAAALHKKDRLIRSSYTIVVTYDCNFRCPYCFELGAVNDKLRQQTITIDMINRIFNFICENEKTKIHPCKTITLFGGEPLLKKNLSIVEDIITKGQSAGFHFSAITNGYDLDSFVYLLSPERIRSVQITIDGMETLHNSKRIHCLGKPTFKKIVDNIGRALSKDIYVTVRFNTDKTNYEHLQLLKQYFDDLGYTKNKKFCIDSARLVNYHISDSGVKQKQFFSQKEFLNMHNAVNFNYGCHDYGTYAKLYSAIKSKRPLPYKSTFCSAQTESYVFDPQNRIYPCWEVIGKNDFQIGHFSNDSIVWNEEKLQAWHNINVWSYKECRTCRYALLCGGGCHASNMDRHHCVRMADIVRYAAQRAFINNLKS